MSWFAQAPANIALIKYMGKKNNDTNLPENPSLSYTLNNLLTSVTMDKYPGHKDLWEPLPTVPGGPSFQLSTQAQQRFLQHLDLIKRRFNYQGSFLVRSSNNFPHSSGLASSASSFAALTRCAVRAMCELQQIPLISDQEQAQISRLGSGSSCRSFFSPWALWEDDKVDAITLPYTQLIHQVIIINHAEKSVSSSEAHERIKSSTFYETRSARAKENLRVLLDALQNQDWRTSYEVCWREFHDMHQLFATCDKPFVYMAPDSTKVLNILQNFWQEHGDGPIVTMDAGPNIHLLYRLDQEEMARQFKLDYLVGNYDVL
jgi:diphosphomevalonate decarboxylase